MPKLKCLSSFLSSMLLYALFELAAHLFEKSKTLKRRRRMLAIVNPFSGMGVALKMWNNKMKPILDEANIDSTLMLTGLYCFHPL